jgi:hypothetical protein
MKRIINISSNTIIGIRISSVEIEAFITSEFNLLIYISRVFILAIDEFLAK